MRASIYGVLLVSVGYLCGWQMVEGGSRMCWRLLHSVGIVLYHSVSPQNCIGMSRRSLGGWSTHVVPETLQELPLEAKHCIGLTVKQRQLVQGSIGLRVYPVTDGALSLLQRSIYAKKVFLEVHDRFDDCGSRRLGAKSETFLFCGMVGWLAILNLLIAFNPLSLL